MRLKGKVAVVTGAGRGMGEAICEAFAHEGAAVAVAARTQPRIHSVVQGLKDRGAKAMALPVDVTNRLNVDMMVKRVLKEFGTVDILVNNAAVDAVSPVAGHDDDLWEKVIKINLVGTYLCTKAVLQIMLEKRSGRIINIASVMGKVGLPYHSAYSASKHGVLGFTKALALEVEEHGITVNAICPGITDTPISRAMAEAEEFIHEEKDTPDEALEKLARALVPQQRFIKPGEVAELAVFLASDEAAGLTGLSLNLSGGWVSR